MRSLLLSAVLAIFLAGCVGTDDSAPLLQLNESVVYGGSVINFAESDLALVRFRTGDNPRMQLRLLKGDEWSTFVGTPTVRAMGESMRVEANLADLGPIVLVGKVDQDRVYRFEAELRGTKATGQASLLGRAPGGVGIDPGVKPGQYAFRFDDGGGDDVYRLNPRAASGFNFTVSNIREEGGLILFDTTPLAGSPFREPVRLIDGDASMGYPSATFQADLQGGITLYIYLSWDNHETRCRTDFGFSAMSSSGGGGVLLRHTTSIGTSIVLKPR